ARSSGDLRAITSTSCCDRSSITGSLNLRVDSGDSKSSALAGETTISTWLCLVIPTHEHNSNRQRLAYDDPVVAVGRRTRWWVLVLALTMPAVAHAVAVDGAATVDRPAERGPQQQVSDTVPPP